MRELHILFTQINNMLLDSPKKSDNNYESNPARMLSAKFELFKQYHNQRKPIRKMLNNFFTEKSTLTNSSENTV